jgi:hypothetical protein
MRARAEEYGRLVILDSMIVDATSFARRTGWVAKPEGLCKADLCVPAPGADRGDGTLDVPVVADRLRMPLVHDDTHAIWALGPESGGRALTSAEAADPELITADGNPFALSSLHGRKVLLVAWASW